MKIKKQNGKNLNEKELNKDLENKLNEKLIEFAKKHNQVIAVTKGCDIEEGYETHYFLFSPPKFNPELEDSISILDLYLARKDYNCHLMSWPLKSKSNLNRAIKEYPHLGNILWKQN